MGMTSPDMLQPGQFPWAAVSSSAAAMRGTEVDWSRQLWGNTVAAWLIAAGAALVGAILVYGVVRWIRAVLIPRAAVTDSMPLRAIIAGLRGIRLRILVPIAIVIALTALDFSPRTTYWLRAVLFALVGIQIAICINRMLVVWLRRSTADEDRVPVMTSILTWTVQFLVWLTFALALLTNMGVNITAFVASLGVGGIAVALALQNILGDLFASVSIGLDKPFEPGDYIAFGDSQGTVRRVGIKSTRIMSLDGEEMAIANSKLLEQLVHNYSRMPRRRIVFQFTVPFNTPPDDLTAIREYITELISGQELVRFDRGHFIGFGDHGFEFEFVYYLTNSDYTLYRDTQQRINEAVVKFLAERDITFAVPSRSVTVVNRPGQK